MARFVGALALVSCGVAAADPAWQVIQKTFSAVTIGISFKNDQVGWTSHSDGHLPVIVRTQDGGKTWAQVNSTKGITAMTLGVAAVKGGVITDVATTGVMASSTWSLDGDNFVQSIGAPFISQDIKFQSGRMVVADPKGVCFSSTGGALYTCKAVPFRNPGSGRYASAPSKDVIFVTAGKWPSMRSSVTLRDNGAQVFHVTRNLRVVRPASGPAVMELGQEEGLSAPQNETGNYTAELWKSTDGGATWKNLFSDVNNFYFNDIHCIDETHCVAVGEGFAEDSGSPGARVFVTSDGEKFDLVHSESTLGTESLTAVKMVSTTEHWVGGTTKVGGMTAPTLLLHSRDAGKSYTNEHNNIQGQMVTSFDVISPTHAYATSVSALQICSLLEYGGASGDAIVV